ncbi:penicillin-binding protein [Patescibacteria group bacterium]|nr:penicillin-binding protein [Patescibacteria group bacterium]
MQHKNFRTSQTWASKKKASVIWEKLQKIFPFIKNKKMRRILLKNTILGAIALFLIGIIVSLGMFAWLSKDLPDPNSLTLREVPESTKILDRTGEHILYEISGDEKRTLVMLDEIPDYVVQATISAEDRKFYDHHGIDVKGIIRAMLYNIKTLDPTGQGASTITQQLVENAILTNKQSYIVKFQEVLLALALERRYTKDEIIQMYLNEIPYGSTNYGIQSAAKAYFDKNVSDISLAEAATLAALPNRPTALLNNPDLLLARRNWILESMADFGYITEEEYRLAITEETPVKLDISNMVAPHFVLWVKEKLVEEYGELVVEQGGLTVTTTLDYDKQVYANDAVANNTEARSSSYGFNNSGLVATNPKTGEILAMVGSADYFNDDIDGQVNVTTRPLQPGSSFKPIVYTAAFEMGYTPNTILWDVETNFPTNTGTYSPKNYDLSEHGAVTIRKALQGSLNIPAVKMLYLVGVQNALDFAEKLGYSSFEDRSDFGLAIVLGGAEVKLLDHVNAYATFANEGEYNDPISILKVEDSNKDVLFEIKQEDIKGEEVLSVNTARTISNVLSDNEARAYAFGTASYLTLSGRPVAAKTGTTNDYKDAWTVGYTPSLAAGVWTGNTNGKAMNRGAGGSTVAAPIWNEFMRNALAGTPVEYFTSPSIPVTGKDILDGVEPVQIVEIDKASGLLATENTPESFIERKICGEYHSILYYVDKTDPTGSAPSDPSKDPYYNNFESAIQEYIIRHNENLKEDELPLETCEIPEDVDNLHVSANKPSVRITSPTKNEDITRSVTIQIDATANRGINKVEYYIDDTYVKASSSSRGVTIDLPSWVDAGQHKLSVIAFDDIDNSGTDSVQIKVTESGLGSSFSITNPFNGQEIEKIQPIYTIVVEGSSLESMDTLTVTTNNLWTGAVFSIYSSKPSNFNAVEWTLPSEAEYIITATAIKGSAVIEAIPIKVFVKEPVTPSASSTE